MAGIQVKLDRKVEGKVLEAVVGGINDSLEMLLETSNRTVPIEEATLGRSGSVVEATVTKPIGAVTYDTAYAKRQHEDLRLRHDPGRRAKWLERTFHEQAPRIGGHIAAAARRRLP